MTARGTVLYRARWSVLMQASWALLLLAPLPLSLFFTIFSGRREGDVPGSGTSLPLDIALGIALWLPFGVVLAAVLWMNSRAAMTITTAGIERRGLGGSRWLAWPSIARIEASDDWFLRGATRIVTAEGERITLRFTAGRYTAFRNEPLTEILRAVQDHRRVPLPTRMAIECHLRQLRGEFDIPPRGADGALYG